MTALFLLLIVLGVSDWRGTCCSRCDRAGGQRPPPRRARNRHRLLLAGTSVRWSRSRSWLCHPVASYLKRAESRWSRSSRPATATRSRPGPDRRGRRPAALRQWPSWAEPATRLIIVAVRGEWHSASRLCHRPTRRPARPASWYARTLRGRPRVRAAVGAARTCRGERVTVQPAGGGVGDQPRTWRWGEPGRAVSRSGCRVVPPESPRAAARISIDAGPGSRSRPPSVPRRRGAAARPSASPSR